MSGIAPANATPNAALPSTPGSTPMTQQEVRAKVAALSAFQTPRRESPWRRVARDFLASKTATFGLAVAALLMVAALTAPWLTPQNPYDPMQLDVLDARLPPGSANWLCTYKYWLRPRGGGLRPGGGIGFGISGSGSARTGRGVICTPAFCMACASASESVSVQPCWRVWSAPWPVCWQRISAARPMRC